MERDLTIDHVLLALANPAHIGSDSIGRCAKLRGVPNEMGDPRAPQFVLGWETGNGRARATDPAALHNRDFLAGTAEVPREQLAALATSENDRIELFRPGHDDLSNDSTELVGGPEEHRAVALRLCPVLRSKTHRRAPTWHDASSSRTEAVRVQPGTVFFPPQNSPLTYVNPHASYPCLGAEIHERLRPDFI